MFRYFVYHNKNRYGYDDLNKAVSFATSFTKPEKVFSKDGKIVWMDKPEKKKWYGNKKDN